MPNNPLSKNIISNDLATNDLEKLVANMTGSHIPEEQTSGLGKELKKILPGAGGLLPEYGNPEVGKVLGIMYKHVPITLFDCMIPDKDIELEDQRGNNIYEGSYPGFKAPTGEVDICDIVIGGTGIPKPCDYEIEPPTHLVSYDDEDIYYEFYEGGFYRITNNNGYAVTIHPTRIRAIAYILTPTAVWRDESELPIPSPTDAGKAVVVNNSGEYTLTALTGDYIVTFSGATSTNNAACDRTLTEITSAVSEGKSIRVRYSLGNYGYYDFISYLMSFTELGNVYNLQFSCTVGLSGSNWVKGEFSSTMGVLINKS